MFANDKSPRPSPSRKKIPGEVITLHCAHGNTVLYPLADMNVNVNGIEILVRAALPEALPVLVLLGTDIPQLGHLLKANPHTVYTSGVGEAMAAQARESERIQAELQRRQVSSGVPPTPLDDEPIPHTPDHQPEELPFGVTLDEDLFVS